MENQFCKYIKSCQLLNILNAPKNVHRWVTFLLTLVQGKGGGGSFIIKLKVLEFFKLNCASISQNSHPKAKAFLPPVLQI